jgi:hypothetical protein
MANLPIEPHYNALWPLSRRAVEDHACAPRLPDLNGKVIGELWDVIFRGETIYPQVREQVRAKFPGAKFVEYSEFGNFYGPKGEAIAATLADKLKAHKVDAVIVGIGA